MCDRQVELFSAFGFGENKVSIHFRQNMRQFSELQMSFCFERCVFTSWLGPIPCKSLSLFFLKMIVFGHTIHLYQKKRPTRSEKLRLCFLLDCLLVFHTGEKEQDGQFHVSPVTTRLSFPVSSLFSPLLHQRLSLDDGVPVEVVLDVVCSEHAPHLEVSQRQPVLLLLAQLAEMA